MSGITLNEPKMSDKIALEHIWHKDENGDNAVLAYAPGNRITADDLDGVAKGCKTGPATLEGPALSAAIAEARGVKVDSQADGGLSPAGEDKDADDKPKTKDVRGPKDKPKPDPDASGPEATAAAVKLAEAEGVDLALVTGSGKDGKIGKPDVEAFIAERG